MVVRTPEPDFLCVCPGNRVALGKSLKLSVPQFHSLLNYYLLHCTDVKTE